MLTPQLDAQLYGILAMIHHDVNACFLFVDFFFIRGLSVCYVVRHCWASWDGALLLPLFRFFPLRSLISV